jgi:hypothetical protein
VLQEVRQEFELFVDLRVFLRKVKVERTGALEAVFY